MEAKDNWVRDWVRAGWIRESDGAFVADRDLRYDPNYVAKYLINQVPQAVQPRYQSNDRLDAMQYAIDQLYPSLSQGANIDQLLKEMDAYKAYQWTRVYDRPIQLQVEFTWGDVGPEKQEEYRKVYNPYDGKTTYEKTGETRWKDPLNWDLDMEPLMWDRAERVSIKDLNPWQK